MTMPVSKRETFSMRMQTAREELGLTQSDLAEKLGAGVDQTVISRYESGKVLPKLARQEQIAVALRKPLSWFFEDEPFVSRTIRPIGSSGIEERALRAELNQVKRLYSAMGERLQRLESLLDESC